MGEESIFHGFLQVTLKLRVIVLYMPFNRWKNYGGGMLSIRRD